MTPEIIKNMKTQNTSGIDIIGWYKESSDQFLCTSCFQKNKSINKEEYTPKRMPDLKKDDYKCDECGKNMRTENIKKSISVVVGMALFVIGVPILIIAMLSGGEPAEKNTTSESMAFIQSNEFVKLFLKSPASADFPFADYSYRESGDGKYIITSYVDSQNSFGATLRNDYTAILKYNGGNDADIKNWKLEYLMMNGQEMYSSP
jgi:hypothetical protein